MGLFVNIVLHLLLVGVRSQPFGYFVVKPFQNWKKAREVNYLKYLYKKLGEDYIF